MVQGGYERDGAEFSRGLGFFDVIYGFAITLLVLNLELPPAKAWESLSALLSSGLGHQLIGFALSFLVIALFWRGNTALMRRVSGIDNAVIMANLLTAALIVLIPFSTQGISDPEIADLPLPTALYAVNIAAALLAQSMMFEVARARGLVLDDAPRSAWWAQRLNVVVSVAVFLLSVPVTYATGPAWGQRSWAVLLVLSPIVGRWSDRVEARARAGSGPQ